ncbi:MAG: HEPN domain-containing protein [Chitinivibrionales bacterium]|nr:HEPN domain-containing protein [Chitinivibrionales bacterium]
MVSVRRRRPAAAKELHNERDCFFHQTCLLCQHSAEKYLKAFLLSQGCKLAKTHELSRLVSECLAYDESFETLFPPCELLNGYTITGRYPGDLPFESTTKEDATRAIDAALEVEAFVLAKRAPSSRGEV